MNSFAIFRLPGTDCCTMIEGNAVVVPSLAELDSQQGFLLAPFMASKEEPILLIRPDVLTVDSPLHLPPFHLPPSTFHLPPSSYASDFNIFHHAILDGRFRKLVLARCAAINNDNTIQPTDLFKKACQLYPRMFVALVSTPQSGLWLIASPEILLESLSPVEEDKGKYWHTIALAGTMRLRSDKADDEGQRLRWSAKNIQEQRYVASYLADVLRRFSDDVREEGPRTVRAGQLVHLRSDFTFHQNKECTRAGELLDALHPTPAVCGLPKEEARRFILNHEHVPRSYYSGFMGPFNLQPSTLHFQPSTLNLQPSTLHLQPSTHLYVSLRCMHITHEAYHLYAGGGLLRESIQSQEWQETESKMDTMRRVIGLSPATP